MLYVGLQIDKNVDTDEVFKKLEELGIKKMEHFKNEESGVFAMGVESTSLTDIEEFSNDEIYEEYHKREM